MNRPVGSTVIVLAVALSALALMFNTARAESPGSLDEYRAAVAHTLALVEQAAALPVADRAPLLAQASAELERVNPVRLPSGAELRVDNGDLRALVLDAKNSDAVLARLSALRRALDAPLVTVRPSDLSALHDILNRPPFVTSASTSWIEELLNRLRELLSRLVLNTAQGVFDTRDLIILIGIIVVVGVLVYFVRHLRKNIVPEQVLPLPTDDTLAETSSQAFSKAQQLVVAGDYRAAVRQLYIATLLLLDERGRINFDRSLTNREVLHHATSDARIATALEPIVATFDRTWYGFEALTDAEFTEYRNRVEAARNL